MTLHIKPVHAPIQVKTVNGGNFLIDTCRYCKLKTNWETNYGALAEKMKGKKISE